MCTFTIRYRLKERKRAVAIVGRAITIREAIQKRTNLQNLYKIEAKGLRATTLLSQSWKSDN